MGNIFYIGYCFIFYQKPVIADKIQPMNYDDIVVLDIDFPPVFGQFVYFDEKGNILIVEE